MASEETLSTAATGSPVAATLECPACGTENTIDSKFCRQCGHLLRALPTPGNDIKKALPLDGSDQDEQESLTSPAEIDARRARQLLDRALLLSERGDLNAALLACRQAVALDHNHAEPYALLGTLLERNGDLNAAMHAYERVVEIDPSNTLERDSLNRLKARLEKAPAFNFNPDELFGSDEVLPSVASADGAVAVPVDTSVEREEHGIEARLPPTSGALLGAGAAAALTDSASASPEAPLVFDFDPAPEGALPSVSPLASALDSETVAGVGAALPPSTVDSVPAGGSPSSDIPKIERRLAQRRQVNIPVATERRTQGERRVPTTVAGATFLPSPRPRVPAPVPLTPLTPASALTQPVAPLDFSFGATKPAPTPLWAQMLRGTSFFGRTLPLVAVGVLGLGFLSWARSQGVAREVNAATSAATVVVPGDTTVVTEPEPPTPPTGFVAATPAPPSSGGGFPVTNATAAPVVANAPASNGATTAPVVAGNRPAAAPPRAGGGATGRTTPVRAGAGSPSFPVPVAPAPVPPAPAGSTTGGNTGTTGGGNNGNGSTLVLPPPQTSTQGGATPPIPVSSLGTNPLNPAGSPQESRIRITRGSLGRPVTRSGTVARGNERAATAAAATGNADRAINNLTGAINATGSDQGFLLQQRATAFLDRGDTARAVEDFNASINAYQDQINRGENVAAAQAGQRAARSGLNVALSRR